MEGLPDTFARAFASQAHLSGDLASAGFGYAPTRTGGLAVHRDAWDGVTVLIALDAVTTGNGAVHVYAGSHEFEPTSSSDKNLPRQLEYKQYPSVPILGDSGDVFCFNARTYHCGIPNVSTTGRIIFNATVGSSVPTCISTARLVRADVPSNKKKRSR
jgi:ectoine hydroxylase-related dioxygenase (phytanoyl-CoA dioxygenase family)